MRRRPGRERSIKQVQFERAQQEQKLEIEKIDEEARKSNTGQVEASPAPVKNAKLPKLQNIVALLMITGSHSRKIHEFYEKLLFTLQSLETLGKLTEMNGYVKMSIDKLQGIRGDLVRTDDN